MPFLLAIGGVLLVLTCRFGLAGLARLSQLEIHGGQYVVLAALAQMGTIVTQRYRMAWLALTIVLLLLFIRHNWRQPALLLATFGIALNFVAMGANGGSMPVSAATVAHVIEQPVADGTFVPLSKGQVVDDAATPLIWLGDRLLLPGPLAQIGAWSIGDVLLIIGIGVWLGQAMKGTSHVRSARSHRTATS